MRIDTREASNKWLLRVCKESRSWSMSTSMSSTSSCAMLRCVSACTALPRVPPSLTLTLTHSHLLHQELRGIFELYASELLQLCMDDTRSFYEQRDSVLAADFIEIYQLRLDQGKTTTPLADLTRTVREPAPSQPPLTQSALAKPSSRAVSYRRLCAGRCA